MECHQKEGEMIYGVEIPNIFNTNSTRFAGNFQKGKKKVTIGIIFKHKSFQPSKFCYSNYGPQGIKPFMISSEGTN
jgi:hypothetical protein